jgi:hypothetical protein
MAELDTDGSDDPTAETAVKVTAGGMGGGERTVYLAPGQYVEVRADGPNYVKVNAHPTESNPAEDTQTHNNDHSLEWR